MGAGKLSTLPQLGIKAIYLNYRTTSREDRYGSQFRYQARVVSSNPRAGKTAYDVFFAATGTSGVRPAAAASRPGTGTAGILGILALLAASLLLSMRPAVRWHRRAHAGLADLYAGDEQAARPAPRTGLASKS